MDSVLAGVLWLLLVGAQAGQFSYGWAADIGYVVLMSALVIPLAWRRRAPVTSGAIIIAGYLLQLAIQAPMSGANLSVFWVVYALAAFGPRWMGIAAFALAIAGAGAASLVYGFLISGLSNRSSVTDALIVAAVVGAFLGVCWLSGDLTRSRRLLVAELWGRSVRLEMEQKQERELAAADERARIAREMHDIVAHSLSVIITQADGGRYAAQSDPALAEKTLKTIADTGRESLAEMRRLLGVLRADEDVLTRPVPALGDIDNLVAGLRDAGVAVESVRVGEQRRALPMGAELVAYRVVQESFTNVLKHAGPGASVRLLRSWDAHGLMIEVDDDGRGAAADEPGTAGGQGIRGMTERVGLYGGSVTAGPRRGGGFRVTVVLPYGGA